MNLVTILKISFNLSFFNYLVFSMPALSLYISFYSKVLYFIYYSLLRIFFFSLLFSNPFTKYYLIFFRYSSL